MLIRGGNNCVTECADGKVVGIELLPVELKNDCYLTASLSLVSTRKNFPGKTSWNDKNRTRIVPTEFILLSVCHSCTEKAN